MKPFTAIAVVLFALIAVLQLIRFMMSWEVMVNGATVPVWASGVAFAIAAAMTLGLWREARR